MAATQLTAALTIRAPPPGSLPPRSSTAIVQAPRLLSGRHSSVALADRSKRRATPAGYGPGTSERFAVAPLKASHSGNVVLAVGSGSLVEVTIVLGSRSDLPIAEKAVKVLKEFGISHQLRIASAHRAPKYLEGIIETAEANGCKVFIGMAGVAAALPGVIASMTGKPVIGVPCGGSVPYDSLLSIVQMPPGMPVATVGTDRGDNAAVLAVQILAAFDPALGAKFAAYRAQMTEKVIADDERTVAEYSW